MHVQNVLESLPLHKKSQDGAENFAHPTLLPESWSLKLPLSQLLSHHRSKGKNMIPNWALVDEVVLPCKIGNILD